MLELRGGGGKMQRDKRRVKERNGGEMEKVELDK